MAHCSAPNINIRLNTLSRSINSDVQIADQRLSSRALTMDSSAAKLKYSDGYLRYAISQHRLADKLYKKNTTFTQRTKSKTTASIASTSCTAHSASILPPRSSTDSLKLYIANKSRSKPRSRATSHTYHNEKIVIALNKYRAKYRLHKLDIRSMDDASKIQELIMLGRMYKAGQSRPCTLPVHDAADSPAIVPEISVLQASPKSHDNSVSLHDCVSTSLLPVESHIDENLLSSGERERAFNRRSLRAKLGDSTNFLNRVTRKLSQPIINKAIAGFGSSVNITQQQETLLSDEQRIENMNHPQASLLPSLSNDLRSTPWKQQIKALFQPSDNKLAMKLFGTRTALLKERSRHKETGHFVVHPCSPFRYYWDFFMLIMLMTTMLASPVAIAFFNNVDEIGWVIYNCFCDSCFLMDIIVNFRTGIIRDDVGDEVILDPHLIAIHYVKSWFVLDLISSIPLDYFFLLVDVNSQTANMGQLVHAGRALRILRLAKLLSLLRLLRVSRLVRYVNEWEEFLNIAAVVVRVLNLTFLILLLGHWDACLQFLVPMLRDFPPDSWPALEEIADKSWAEQYTWSLFRALSHMLCIGYGRFPPQNPTDTWLTMTSMMCGAICYAMFVGHVTALIQSFDTAKRLYREKFKQVEEYMSYRKLPRQLRERISDYYEHRYQGRMFDENTIMLELSDCLRTEIANHNCRTLVLAVPFLKHADPNFVASIVPSLRFEVYQPGDLIVKVDTYGDRMYFIQEGTVDVITAQNEVVTSLSDGAYFGEICLLGNARRSATVKAVTYCYLYALKREQFDCVLNEYPIMRKTIESIAAERLVQIGLDPAIVGRRADVNDDIEAVKELMEKVIALEKSEDSKNCTDSDEATESDNAINHCKNRRRKCKQFTASLSLFKTRSQTSLNDELDTRNHHFRHSQGKTKHSPDGRLKGSAIRQFLGRGSETYSARSDSDCERRASTQSKSRPGSSKKRKFTSAFSAAAAKFTSPRKSLQSSFSPRDTMACGGHSQSIAADLLTSNKSPTGTQASPDLHFKSFQDVSISSGLMQKS